MAISLTSSCWGFCDTCKDVEIEGKPICMQVAIMERREISAESWVEIFSERFRMAFEKTGSVNRMAIEREMFARA